MNEFDFEEISRGDYVDFGPYGKLYVIETGAGVEGDKFWVTDVEDDRFNSKARGNYIRKSYAKKIIERADDIYDEDWAEEFIL